MDANGHKYQKSLMGGRYET